MSFRKLLGEAAVQNDDGIGGEHVYMPRLLIIGTAVTATILRGFGLPVSGIQEPQASASFGKLLSQDLGWS